MLAEMTAAEGAIIVLLGLIIGLMIGHIWTSGRR